MHNSTGFTRGLWHSCLFRSSLSPMSCQSYLLHFHKYIITMPKVPPIVQKRIDDCEQLLAQEVIDLDAVREFAVIGNDVCVPYWCLGIPDASPETSHLRPCIWKVRRQCPVLYMSQILLGYLPLIRASWDEVLTSQRRAYADFKRDLIPDPHKKSGDADHVCVRNTL